MAKIRQEADPGYKLMVIGHNFWGAGDTLGAAKTQYKKVAGYFPIKGTTVLHLTEDFEINEVDGTVHAARIEKIGTI